MVKNTKKSSPDQESFKVESWYIALWTQGLPICSNDDPRLTFELLRQGQMCVPMHLYQRLMAETYNE